MSQRFAHFNAMVTGACFFGSKQLLRPACFGCHGNWPPQNLQTGPSQIGHQIPQPRAHHCRSSGRLPHGTTSCMSGVQAYGNVPNKVASNCGPGSAWNNIGNLPDNRWLKHALAWTTGRRTKIRRPKNTCDSQTQIYCRRKCLGEWRTTAMLTDAMVDTYPGGPFGLRKCVRSPFGQMDSKNTVCT